jgi:hypothetical protein
MLINKSFEGLVVDNESRMVRQEQRRFPVPARLSRVGQKVTDWNAATGAGWYWGYMAANQPGVGENYWAVEVSATVNGNTILQTGFAIGTPDGREYYRYSKDNGATWSAWAQEMSAHIGESTSTGRSYFSTSRMTGAATSDTDATYIGMEPFSGASNDAIWFARNGVGNYAHIPKNTQSVLLYDSGLITSGLTITPASGWSIDSYALRNKNGRVHGVVSVKYSGTALTAGSDANLSDQTTFIRMPTGWRMSNSKDEFVVAQVSGYPGFMVRVRGTANTAGAFDLTAGTFPGQVLASGVTLEVPVDYDVD